MKRMFYLRIGGLSLSESECPSRVLLANKLSNASESERRMEGFTNARIFEKTGV